MYINSREVLNILSHGPWAKERSGNHLFAVIRTLQKICNHPDILDAADHFSTHGPMSARYKIAKGMPIRDASIDDERYGAIERSGKMIVLQRILRLWNSQGHRALLFTQGTKILDILESFVKREGYTYSRMDGTTGIRKRQPLIDKFNAPDGPFLFLLTTRVGGLGVNLIGANRVILYDPDWNPCTDMQARERVWRIGQKQSVIIYRLMLSGTIEEKMYHRQIFKQYLSHKILNDPRQRRFFKYNTYRDLFTLDAPGSAETETSNLFEEGKVDVPESAAAAAPEYAAPAPVLSSAPAKARRAVARAMATLKQLPQSEEEQLRQIPGVKSIKRTIVMV